MTDIWTDNVPTEPGLYWVKPKEVDGPPMSMEVWRGSSGVLYVDDWTLDEFVRKHVLRFGPRIPQPEQLAEMAEKAAMLEWFASQTGAHNDWIRRDGYGNWMVLAGEAAVMKPTLIEAIRAAMQAEGKL